MVFYYGEGEGVGRHRDVFVGNVGFTVGREVAEQVHGFVEVGDGVGLVADEVVEPVCGVGVDEAVADPLAGADGFVDVGHDFEGGFDAVFVCEAGGDALLEVLAREAEDVEGFLAGEGDELAGGCPVDLSTLVLAWI